MIHKSITAALIIIGNEILSGRTQDANTAYIGENLANHGVSLCEVRIIPDIESTIISTVNEMRANFTYVFTTGGIGPTHDDITAASIAKAFSVELQNNKEAHSILLNHYGTDNLNEARLRMARIPEGAILIDNPVSAAPGFNIGNVYVMAGVPKIMQAMFDNILSAIQGSDPILSRTISCALPESAVAKDLKRLQGQYPEIDIGSYPYFHRGNNGVSIVLRGVDSITLDRVATQTTQIIVKCGGHPKTH